MSLGVSVQAALAGVGTVTAAGEVAQAPTIDVSAEISAVGLIVVTMVRGGDPEPEPSRGGYPVMPYPDLVIDNQPPRDIGYLGRGPHLGGITPPNLNL